MKRLLRQQKKRKKRKEKASQGSCQEVEPKKAY